MSSDLELSNKLELKGGGTGLQNRIVQVAGRKGSGKSTLTREILQHSRRLFIFDTMGEHSWVPDQFTALDEACYYIANAGAECDAQFIGSFTPEGASENSLDTSFAEICTAVYESGNMSLAVEELPMLSKPQFNPPAFDRVIRLGRHRSLNVLCTEQRLSEVPRRVTAASDMFVLFSHTEPRDLDAIAERCGPEVAEKCARLGEHYFIVYEVRTRCLLVVDSSWYSSVLAPSQVWTPAVGRNGRKALWSLDT
jgi:hypothetical protein